VSDTASLPRDPDILIGMIADLRDENDKLRAIVETLRRTLFGARSEKLTGDAAQLLLALDDMSTAPREPEPEHPTGQPRAPAGERQTGAQHRRSAQTFAA
jgi:Transposase C of IS166 homeodomain